MGNENSNTENLFLAYRLHLQAPRQASALGFLLKAFEEVSLIPPSPRGLGAPLEEYPRWS